MWTLVKVFFAKTHKKSFGIKYFFSAQVYQVILKLESILWKWDKLVSENKALNFLNLDEFTS